MTTSPSVIEGWSGPALQVGVSFAAAMVMVAAALPGTTWATPLSSVPPLSVSLVIVITLGFPVGLWSEFE